MKGNGNGMGEEIYVKNACENVYIYVCQGNTKIYITG